MELKLIVKESLGHVIVFQKVEYDSQPIFNEYMTWLYDSRVASNN